MWDDAPGNPTKKGGYLIFLHQLSKKQTNPRVEIHKIMCVKPRSHKLPSWSNRCRNVLFLSERIYTITWNDWENLEVGSSWREMGTRRMADPEKSSKLVKYVEEKIAEIRSYHCNYYLSDPANRALHGFNYHGRGYITEDNKS